jgi:hypothetical protein
VGLDGVEEEDVMFDDEKLAAHQEVLEDHNYDHGWAVHGPAVQPKPKTGVEPQKNGPAPGVLQVDSADAHVLVDGIASAVGQVAGDVAPAAVVLDLGGRPLQASAPEAGNPKVRQALERMAACREQYKNLTPEQLAEENADINRRLSQKYRTECALPGRHGVEELLLRFEDDRTVGSRSQTGVAREQRAALDGDRDLPPA